MKLNINGIYMKFSYVRKLTEYSYAVHFLEDEIIFAEV